MKRKNKGEEEKRVHKAITRGAAGPEKDKRREVAEGGGNAGPAREPGDVLKRGPLKIGR